MDYDLAVIGAGWAGFNAAIRAKELGLKVALIEKDKIGGTCLNYGCIPTKALIQSAKVYTLIKKSKTFGIETTDPKIDFTEIQKRKDKVIEQLRNGLDFMLKGVDIFRSEAKILSSNSIAINSQHITTKFILIAVGSRPMELASLKIDGKKIVSSNEILNLKEIPHSLLIIGGGVIGCEFASLFSCLGCQVSIAELMPQLLPGLDKEVAKKLESIFKKKGIKVSTSIDATTLTLDNYELVLLCLGRTPNIGGLHLDKLGIKLEKNRIVADEYLRTSVPNIYAAGDCTGQFKLAHFAAYQGRIAVTNIANPNAMQKADNLIVPNCIFTEPEISSVGLTEEDAKARGIEMTVNRFDLLGSGMARVLEETEGFIKIISHTQTKVILGASIIGPRAAELIGILTLAIQQKLTVSQIRDLILPHPTVSEIITDALK